MLLICHWQSCLVFTCSQTYSDVAYLVRSFSAVTVNISRVRMCDRFPMLMFSVIVITTLHWLVVTVMLSLLYSV